MTDMNDLPTLTDLLVDGVVACSQARSTITAALLGGGFTIECPKLVSGQRPYTVAPCPRCNGTGKLRARLDKPVGGLT